MLDIESCAVNCLLQLPMVTDWIGTLRTGMVHRVSNTQAVRKKYYIKDSILWNSSNRAKNLKNAIN